MKKILGISFLAVVLFSSCKKDEATPTCTEGATSCNPPTDPFTANYTLTGNSLNISYMGFTLPAATISDFTCNGFKITSVDQTSGEISVTTVTKQ